MPNFWEEMGKALGYWWHKKRKSSIPTYAAKHAKIDAHTEKLYKDVEELYSQIYKKAGDKDSGKTYAKIFYEKNRPEWYWLITHVPKDIVDRIKQASGIED